MKIKKRVHGEIVDIEFEKIVNGTSYDLYQIYKIEKRRAYTFIY